MDDFDFDNYWNQEEAFEDAVDDLQEFHAEQQEEDFGDDDSPSFDD